MILVEIGVGVERRERIRRERKYRGCGWGGNEAVEPRASVARLKAARREPGPVALVTGAPVASSSDRVLDSIGTGPGTPCDRPPVVVKSGIQVILTKTGPGWAHDRPPGSLQ